jgi:Flp pilus assembly pilin Flp
MVGVRGNSANSRARVGAAVREFLSDESGQAISEYIILLTILAVGVGALAKGILSTMKSGVLVLGGQLEKDLKTGRTTLGVYVN